MPVKKFSGNYVTEFMKKEGITYDQMVSCTGISKSIIAKMRAYEHKVTDPILDRVHECYPEFSPTKYLQDFKKRSKE